MDTLEDKEIKVYEAGFHIAPNITEEEVRGVFSAFKEFILTHKEAQIISEGTPSLVSLAYSISKTVKAVKTNYTEAYFGWVKFETTPDVIEEIKKYFDENSYVIRYLVVSTVKENTLSGIASKTTDEETKEESSKEENATENGAEIDKKIDDLVVS